MLKFKLIMLTIALTISSFSVISANNFENKDAKIDGKWKMSVDVNGQTISATAVFKQSEKTFTGKLSTSMGDGTISNGKIKGNAITADVSVDAQGQLIYLALSGKIENEKMSGTMVTSDGMTINFTAAKEKEEKKK